MTIKPVGMYSREKAKRWLPLFCITATAAVKLDKSKKQARRRNPPMSPNPCMQAICCCVCAETASLPPCTGNIKALRLTQLRGELIKGRGSTRALSSKRSGGRPAVAGKRVCFAVLRVCSVFLRLAVSDWWRCFLKLLVFCLFACVFLVAVC